MRGEHLTPFLGLKNILPFKGLGNQKKFFSLKKPQQTIHFTFVSTYHYFMKRKQVIRFNTFIVYANMF